MTDHDKAISILAKARELCVQRIAAFVVANEDDLLTHAEGTGYANVESLFDAAEQLRHYSIMLDLMPGSQPEPSQGESARAEPAGVIQVMMLTPVTFRLWAEQIMAGDINGAIASLSYLFQIEPELASRCTQHFIMKLSHDRQAMAKVSAIREHVARGSLTGSMLLLQDCFGLQGPEAVHVAKTLQSNFGAT